MKKRSRKDPNDRILQCFALYNKYHLLVYQMKINPVRAMIIASLIIICLYILGLYLPIIFSS